MDVGVEAQVAEAFAEIAGDEGRVDLLVNNVGNYNPQHITRLTPGGVGCHAGDQPVGRLLLLLSRAPADAGGGNIINIGMAGLEGIRANVRGADYYVSKTGLLSLTRVAGGRVRRPGTPRQHGVARSARQLHRSPAARSDWATVPLGRAGELHDVAQAVEYLLDAAYVTGVNIDVAGGYRL